MLDYLRLNRLQVTLGVYRHNGSGGHGLPRLNNPTVLLTRPKASSAEFVAALTKIAGPFEPLISPAFETVPTHDQVPPFDVAIFTSRAGVLHGPTGQGRLAYCVGEATAQAARAAGYDIRSANGDAADLTAMILKERPHGSVLHVRGEVSYGNIHDTLITHGIECLTAIVYRKAPCPPSSEISKFSTPAQSGIFCLFSAETVSIISDWPIDFSNTHAVAISQNVAKAAHDLNPLSITVATAPNLGEMAAATSRLIA